MSQRAPWRAKDCQRKSNSEPLRARESQGEPGRARESQGEPGRARESQGEPGKARETQGEPGRATFFVETRALDVRRRALLLSPSSGFGLANLYKRRDNVHELDV